MNKKKILIVPAASYKDIYEMFIPEIFMLTSVGHMKIIHNLFGMPLNEFDKIYITINSVIDEKYHIKKMLEAQLPDLNVDLNMIDIVVIDETSNVVETILETLKYVTETDCGIFIKDADGYFNIPDLNNENTVYTYMLEDVMQINPAGKSYVSTTSDDIILNIIEKRVISSEFCAGGYYFDDIKRFKKLCENLVEYDKLYLSNVIYYDILHNDEMYRSEQVLMFNE